MAGGMTQLLGAHTISEDLSSVSSTHTRGSQPPMALAPGDPTRWPPGAPAHN